MCLRRAEVGGNTGRFVCSFNARSRQKSATATLLELGRFHWLNGERHDVI